MLFFRNCVPDSGIIQYFRLDFFIRHQQKRHRFCIVIPFNISSCGEIIEPGDNTVKLFVMKKMLDMNTIEKAEAIKRVENFFLPSV